MLKVCHSILTVPSVLNERQANNAGDCSKNFYVTVLAKKPQGQRQKTVYANARSTSPAPPPPANSACPWIRWGSVVIVLLLNQVGYVRQKLCGNWRSDVVAGNSGQGRNQTKIKFKRSG